MLMAEHPSLPSSPISSDPGVWRDQQAASYLNISRDTLRVWRQRRHQTRGPVFVRVGRLVRYLRRDLDAWLASNRVEPTAPASARSSAAGPGQTGGVNGRGADAEGNSEMNA